MPSPFEKRCVDLDDLRARLQSTDLIPSQEPLLDGIAERFALLAGTGITSVSDLQAALRDRGSISSVADASGVDAEYLVLLRRAVRGFYPKAKPLRAFDWVDRDVITALEEVGVKNSRQLHQAADTGLTELAEQAGISVAELSALVALADLVRVQWVGPTFARTLLAAGYSSTAMVAEADPDTLREAVATANEEGRFYKGAIGRRDIKRVIDAAAYAR